MEKRIRYLIVMTIVYVCFVYENFESKKINGDYIKSLV